MLRNLILALLAISASAASVHVAIIPQSPQVTPASDLLTVAFSKIPNVQILERADLDRITRERSLTLNHSAEALTAANLLGAEALLLLESARLDSNNAVTLRLVAVKPGAIVRATTLRWPIDDSDKWLQSVTNQFAPLLPKIAAPEDRLLKISLLNFRSPSSAAASLDRELTALVRIRLSREPNLIVLERQQLATLILEKDLAASTEQFWTGSYLLDGTINRDGNKPDLVTLDLRLSPPGQAAKGIHVEGAATNLLAVADTVTGGILKTIQRSPAGTPRFDPRSEASAYLDESKWSIRWQMYPEAIAAGDSAWALGAKDLDSAVTRLLAYAQSANANPHTGSYNSSAGGQIPVSFRWPDFPPHPEALAELQTALHFAQEILARFPGAATNRLSYTNICEALAWSGKLLSVYYHAVELREGHEDTLADIRRSAREIGAALMPVNAPATAGIYLPAKPLQGMCDDIFTVQAAYAIFFQETPEETAALYKELLTKYPSARYESVFRSREEFPYDRCLFGGWKWRDRKRANEILAKFGAEKIPAAISLILFKETQGFYRDLDDFMAAKERTVLEMIRALAPRPEIKGLSKESLEGFSDEKKKELEAKFQEVRSNAVALAEQVRKTNAPMSPEDAMLLGVPPQMRERLKARMAEAKARREAGIPEPAPRLPPAIQRQLENEKDAPVFSTPSLDVVDFWRPPTAWLEPKPAVTQVLWPILRENRLWFQSRFSYELTEFTGGGYRISRGKTNGLVGVPLDSWKPELVQLTRPEFYSDIYSDSTPNDISHFEVTSNAFYFVHGETLLRRERSMADPFVAHSRWDSLRSSRSPIFEREGWDIRIVG